MIFFHFYLIEINGSELTNEFSINASSDLMHMVPSEPTVSVGRGIYSFRNHNINVIERAIKEKCLDVYSFVAILKGRYKNGFIEYEFSSLRELAKAARTTKGKVERYKPEAYRLGLIKRAENGGIILCSNKTKKNSEIIKIEIDSKESISDVVVSLQAAIITIYSKTQEKARMKYKGDTKICISASYALIMSNKTGGKHLNKSLSWFSKHKKLFVPFGITFQRNKECLGRLTKEQYSNWEKQATHGYLFTSNVDGNTYWERPCFITIKPNLN